MKKWVLLILCLGIMLAGCSSEEKEIRRQIDAANYCQVDADCSLAGSKCPFDCYIYVNKDKQEYISGLLNNYQSQCEYSCISCQSVACIDNKCKPVCE